MGLASLVATCFVALRPLFPFRQAQCAQVFPLKPAPFCMLFAGLGSTIMTAISLLRLSLSSLHRSFYLGLSGKFGRDCFPLLSGYSWSPDTYFSRITTRLISWLGEECYSCILQSLVVSSYLSYPLFSFLELEAYCHNSLTLLGDH